MSNNHWTPRPLCRAFTPLLPLLSMDALDREEAAAVEAHVHTCDYCQREMADYGALRDAILRDAILREDARDAAEGNALPLLTLAAVRRAADREEAAPLVFDAPPPPWERPASRTWRRWRAARAFEALAAVLVIALLSALLAWHGGAGPAHTRTPTPTATQDPISQAYVDMLRTYYVPLAEAYQPAFDCYENLIGPLGGNVGILTPSVVEHAPSSVLDACRAPVQAELAAAQALSAHLASATPPARWQAQHAALQQSTQAIIRVASTELQGITTHDLAQYLSPGNTLDEAALFCLPIGQINVGPPPLSPPLLTIEQGQCGPDQPVPTATPDPASQAYITLLRTYYTPLVSTDLNLRNCYITVENTRKLQDMLACRPLWADQLLLVRTLRTQLATASPPAHWQTQHAALQQAIDGRIAVLTEQLAAIDAQDVTRFLNTTAAQNDNFASFCPIIAQLNAGPPPLSPQLSAPESLMCS
jgi:putative zinc finger protein